MLLNTVRTARRGSQTATRRAAFTLLEVLVVVAILVILASIGVFAYMRYLEDAKKSQAQLKAKALATALNAYTLHPANVGNAQPEQNDWTPLITPTFGSSFLEKGEEDTIDPWNKQFRFGYVSDGFNQIPVVFTYAPDGTPISQYGMGLPASKVDLIQ